MRVLGIKPELSMRLASSFNTEPLVLNFKNIFFIYLFTCLLGVYICYGTWVQGSNLDCQAWWQVSLLTEPTCQHSLELLTLPLLPPKIMGMLHHAQFLPHC